MKYMSIVNIQEKLALMGYYKGIVDGAWGPISDLALRQAMEKEDIRMDFDFDRFKQLFNKRSLTQPLVDSINYLFLAMNKYHAIGGASPVNIAYMLATTWHESAFTMLPIKEYGGDKYLSKYDTGRLARVLGNTPEADGDGQFYAGRGYVMITGKDNYRKFSALLNIDLIQFPDLALDPTIAADILVVGSLKGMFTSKQLSNYIRYGTRAEFIKARKVINGVDDNVSIAEHAIKFVDCIVMV